MSQRIHGIAIPPVVTKYGAPMGRAEWGRPEDCPARGVHLFHVPLDSGGYDRGGAYWGHGQRLYCAYGHEDYRAFVRADSREEAARTLRLDNTLLIRRLR